MKELKYTPLEVDKLIFKDAESVSNYTHVSIKYQQLHEA